MPSAGTFCVSVMAEDRTGIIAHLGQRVLDLGGSIDDLSQTVMRGFFTVLFCARFPEGVGEEAIEIALREGMPDLAVSVKPAPERTRAAAAGERFILTAHGADRPGLVAALGSFLAGRDINIEDMYARVDPSDPERIVMILQVLCPPRRDLRQLQLDLAELAEELGLSAHLQHENVFRATNEVSAVRTLTL